MNITISNDAASIFRMASDTIINTNKINSLHSVAMGFNMPVTKFRHTKFMFRDNSAELC